MVNYNAHDDDEGFDGDDDRDFDFDGDDDRDRDDRCDDDLDDDRDFPPDRGLPFRDDDRDDDHGDDHGCDFADPGGESALRAPSKGNPRNLPCPSCGKPNRLTPADRRRGYQCDGCADRDEGRAPW